MDHINDMWDLNPDNAHPKARQLLTDPLYWDFGDEESPLGTDRGADTLSAYIRYRLKSPMGTVADFLRAELESLGLPDSEWDLVDEGLIEEAIRSGRGRRITTRDDFIMGMAFAQIVLQGEVDKVVSRHAQHAISREATNAVLAFRGWDNEEGRREQLSEMRRILELA